MSCADDVDCVARSTVIHTYLWRLNFAELQNCAILLANSLVHQKFVCMRCTYTHGVTIKTRSHVTMRCEVDLERLFGGCFDEL